MIERLSQMMSVVLLCSLSSYVSISSDITEQAVLSLFIFRSVDSVLQVSN